MDANSTESDRRMPPWLTATLAPILAIFSCVLYSCNGELLQYLQHNAANGGHASPMLNLIVCHLGGLMFAPHFLFWEPSNFSGMNVKRGSLLLAMLLMGYNYAWLLSARFLAISLTNAIFQTSTALVYLAGVFVFHDAPLAAMQLIGVGLSLAGCALASGALNLHREDIDNVGSSRELSLGIFLALCASVGYMAYQVMFKYLYGHHKNDARFLAHVGAWVSVWHIIVMLPLAGLLHVTGIEELQVPHSSLAVLGTLASACIASTVNVMYICMVMWGSSMLLPCASAFSIPLTVFLDMLLHSVVPSRLEIWGHIMIVFSVVLIMDLHKALYRRISPVIQQKKKQLLLDEGYSYNMIGA